MSTGYRSLIAGLGIILLTNAIALGGVVYNRAIDSENGIILTERELVMPYRYGMAKENSGIALRIQLRVLSKDKSDRFMFNGIWSQPEWLDTEKLAAVGFDVSYPLDKADSQGHYRKMLSREVLFVIEYNGDSYQRALQQLRDRLVEEQSLRDNNPDKQESVSRCKATEKALKSEELYNSRLFVIDVGLDEKLLREKYRDSAKYIIARGQVQLNYQGTYKKSPSLRGTITRLSVASVNVPLDYMGLLEPFVISRRGEKSQLPRYQVTLQYGRRQEPWITAITLLSHE